MVEKRLNQCIGRNLDHIGSGFCRYSTNRMWHIPHFEKMLYDNIVHGVSRSISDNGKALSKNRRKYLNLL